MRKIFSIFVCFSESPNFIVEWVFFLVNIGTWQHQCIGKNNNTHTVQAESSKFASVLFDQGFQIWVGWNWSERHLLVFCINPIVPGFVVYYVNCSWHWQFQCDAYSIITRVSYSPRFGRSEYWVCSIHTYTGEPRRIHSAATREASVLRAQAFSTN